MSDRVLRKRSAPAPTVEPPAKKAAARPKKSLADKVVTGVKKGTAKAGATVSGATTTTANGMTSSKAPEVGDTIDIAAFGGDFETNDGKKVTFKEILEESKAGVVLFTYPKASTPGW